MGGRAPGDRSSDPAELLRGTLEKIVFFECRVSQLESELRAAVQTAERARADAAAAHLKAVGFEEALAGARGARATAERRAEELTDRVRMLEAERERLLSGLVEQARVAGAPGGDAPEAGEQADLAGFIAELRAEIDVLRSFKASVEGAAGSSNPGRSLPQVSHASVEAIAGRLAAEGRASVTARDAGALRGQMTTESDRVLFEEAVERLRAAEPAVRLRAVQRLAALGPKAAAPLLAAAVGREPDAEVKVALLSALSRVEEPFAADLAARALDDGRPAVRAAALDAYARLAPDAAEPRVLTALGDESPIVRRRAALLLAYSKGAGADEALAAALRDADAGVARAAAAALAGRPSAEAQQALARALEHRDAGVRRSVAETLGRWSGERVSGDAPDHERRSAARRIAERLAAMAPAEVRSAVVGASEKRQPAGLVVHRFSRKGVTQASVPARGKFPSPPPGERERVRGQVAVAGAQRSLASRVAVAVVEQAAPHTPTHSQAGTREREKGLEDAIVAELRGALRGRATSELSGLLSASSARVEASLRDLAARGAVVARGPRWYVG